MKVRLDFVSNSSSCSYTVACQEKYLAIVAKDLAKACCCHGNKSQYHDPKLASLNKLALDFCLKTYCLAFLGRLVLETRKQTYSLKFFKKMFKTKQPSGFAEKEWKNYKDTLKKLKSGKKVDQWVKDLYGLDEYDSVTDTAVHYKKVKSSRLVVTRDIMEYAFDRWHYSGSSRKDDDKSVANRVKAIIKMAKQYTKSANKNECPFNTPDIYQITQDTIDNTRDMLRMGCTIDFDQWIDLDELEARLANGDAIFYVRIAHDGDGYGDFHIYCEDGADGLDGISGIEIIAGDSA